MGLAQLLLVVGRDGRTGEGVARRRVASVRAASSRARARDRAATLGLHAGLEVGDLALEADDLGGQGLRRRGGDDLDAGSGFSMASSRTADRLEVERGELGDAGVERGQVGLEGGDLVGVGAVAGAADSGGGHGVARGGGAPRRPRRAWRAVSSVISRRTRRASRVSWW